MSDSKENEGVKDFEDTENKDIFLDVLKIGLGFLGGWGAGTYQKSRNK